MIKPFLRVMSSADARRLIKRFQPITTEQVYAPEALHRVLAADIKAVEDMPGFNRSTMDGFAVRSADTFGAGETSPGLFNVVGEIRMGELQELKLKKGQAARIWTGGALPLGADAVIMLEHCEELDHGTIEVLKAVAPFENVVRRGEDYKKDEIVLRSGRRLRPQDLGMLASMGILSIEVFKKPSVAIISSGDEIVPADQQPPPGCMRDVNRHTLTAMVIEAKGTPKWIGISPDSLKELSLMLQNGLEGSDIVIISGGSSMGSRDHVIEAVQSNPDSEILLHGVGVSPGKPLILARIGNKPVIGLPGHPVSAMVCFDQFVVPIMRRLEGEESSHPYLKPVLRASLSRNVPSKDGREDFVRVRLHRKEGKLLAVPVFGKSGIISAMVNAHGYVKIEADCEGLYKGDTVTVNLFADWMDDDLEKEYLSGHEAAGGSSGNIFESSGQEKLSVF